MNIDELKKLFGEGKLTKEQFTAMAGVIDPEFKEEETVEVDEIPPENSTPQEDNPSLEVVVQRAVDRATNKLGNENKKLRGQLDTLKRTKLTIEESAELDRQQREETLQEKERALLERENRLFAIKAIKEAGLDDGSDSSLSLVDFVLSEDSDEISTKVKAFGELMKKMVKAEVDKTFKQNGGAPERGGGKQGVANPFAKDSLNITEQMRLEMENPELAKQLRAAAGV